MTPPFSEDALEDVQMFNLARAKELEARAKEARAKELVSEHTFNLARAKELEARHRKALQSIATTKKEYEEWLATQSTRESET